MTSKAAEKRVRYPRFFRHVNGFGDDTLFVRMDSARTGFLLLSDGRVVASAGYKLGVCLEHVRAGRWREHRLLAKKVLP